MSEMPVFDDVTPETSTPAEQPPRRKPRKPMKRRARAVPVAPKRRVAKKRAARRGRPPGALNKPKPTEQHAGGRFTKAQYNLIGQLLEMPELERLAVLEVVAGLAK